MRLSEIASVADQKRNMKIQKIIIEKCTRFGNTRSEHATGMSEIPLANHVQHVPAALHS